jgi:hypothetical protein
MLFKGAFATGNPGGGWFFNPFDFSVKNGACLRNAYRCVR